MINDAEVEVKIIKTNTVLTKNWTAFNIRLIPLNGNYYQN